MKKYSVTFYPLAKSTGCRVMTYYVDAQIYETQRMIELSAIEKMRSEDEDLKRSYFKKKVDIQSITTARKKRCFSSLV